ncbi:30S ribosomal protein S4 [bacterium]|nr:30S ribosomal protein S4 [bacterium]
MNFYSNKICRRYGIKTSDSKKSPLVRRNYPPGFHGPKGRGRLSDYGQQLAQKQKAKVIYNLREKQFKLTFDKAQKMKGDAGLNFLTLLEMRLDNVIYRLGLANSRPAARQLINHAHITVDGKKVNIPSYKVKLGQEISIRQKSIKNKYFENIKNSLDIKDLPSWLSLDAKTLNGKILHKPKLEDMDQSIDTQAIVEFYSK